MSERLARLGMYRDSDYLALTVFAEHEGNVAFKYDNGGYGWAQRSSFVPLAEAESRAAEIRERRARVQADANYAAELRTLKEISRVERELDRLNENLAHYRAQAGESR